MEEAGEDLDASLSPRSCCHYGDSASFHLRSLSHMRATLQARSAADVGIAICQLKRLSFRAASVRIFEALMAWK